VKSNAPRGLNREKMRDLYKEGYCVEEIARRFKCRTNAVMHHVYDLVVPCVTMIRSNSKLTEKQVKDIRNLFINKKWVASEISDKFKVSQSTVLNVAHGVFYRWVPGEVVGKDGVIYVIPEGFHTKTLSNKKGARKSGPNKSSERMVRAGDLIPIAKKHKVAPCTISRWMRNGKMSTTGKLLKKGS
jgi:predicted DNA-binding protein YlxM (UPF0122 family)